MRAARCAFWSGLAALVVIRFLGACQSDPKLMQNPWKQPLASTEAVFDSATPVQPDHEDVEHTENPAYDCDYFRVGEQLDLHSLPAEARRKGLIFLPLLPYPAAADFYRDFKDIHLKKVAFINFFHPQDNAYVQAELRDGVFARVICHQYKFSDEQKKLYEIPLDRSIDTPQIPFQKDDFIKGPGH